MWLLDANMDVHLAGLLNELGISCATAVSKGWESLSNGQLVAAAIGNDFDCVLTRDRLFAESASRSLKTNPHFAVVLVKLPQQRWPEHKLRFIEAWTASPIKPVPGRCIEWP